MKDNQVGFLAAAFLLSAAGVVFADWLLPPGVAVWLLSVTLVLLFLVVARRSRSLALANSRLRQEAAQRKQVEQELLEQVSLLNLAHDAITMRDMEERIVFWNKGTGACMAGGPRKLSAEMPSNCSSRETHLAWTRPARSCSRKANGSGTGTS